MYKEEAAQVSWPRDEGGAAGECLPYGKSRGKNRERKTEKQVCRRPGGSGWGKSVPLKNAAVDDIEIGVAAHDRQRHLRYVTSVR